MKKGYRSERVLDIQEKLYNYIVRYKRENDGNSPSIRDIMADLSYSSPSVVDFHLRGLVASGRIRITSGRSRSITVPGGEWSLK